MHVTLMFQNGKYFRPYDSMMVITLSSQIRNMTEINISMDWIMKQSVTKFGSLEIDNGGNTVMGSDDNV